MKLSEKKDKQVLTKAQDELTDILIDKDVEMDNIIGIVLTLKSDDEDRYTKAMLKWVKENPKADICDIFDQLDEILD